MEKTKIVQEAFEKAKEVYWEKGKAVCLGIDYWKHSDGSENFYVKLWVDEDAMSAGGKASHIFESESFQKLLDFLGIEDHPEFTFSDGKVYYKGHLVGFPEGDPRFTTFGGAPPEQIEEDLFQGSKITGAPERDSSMKEAHDKNYGRGGGSIDG